MTNPLNRRDLLKSVFGSRLGTASGSIARAEATPHMPPVRVGVIGVGRRSFLKLTPAGAIMLSASARTRGAWRRAEITWYDATTWGVEGKGWQDTERFFDRLPARARGFVRDAVWNESRHSAGVSLRFATDSPAIHVRYRLRSDNLALEHMPATGVSGIDLYAEDGYGVERWVNVTHPRSQEAEAVWAENLAPGRRRYTAYLPLYNGVDALEIGVPNGESFEPIPPRTERPLLFYGTSIMHGASASRPGMAIPAILGRRLHHPTINLGFSGNARMEPEVAALLAELDPCLFVLDALPNMNEEMINERATAFVRRIRAARPQTPILLVEDRSFTNAPFFPDRVEGHRRNRVALRNAYEQLRNAGMDHLHYLTGPSLLGFDGEASPDGSHPSDLGMMRYADAYEPAINHALGRF